MPSETPPFDHDSASDAGQACVPDSYHDGILAFGTDNLLDQDIIVAVQSQNPAVNENVNVNVNVPAGQGHLILSLVPTSASDPPENPPFKLRTTHATQLPVQFLKKHVSGNLPAYLLPDNDVYVLISTLSGTGLAPSFFDHILEPILREFGIGSSDAGYKVVRTNSAGSVKHFGQNVLLPGANEGKKQTVLMLSGDGGMADTINGLLEGGVESSSYRKPNLALLPLGTANALFNSLHRVPPSPDTVESVQTTNDEPSLYVQGLRTFFRGTPQSLPIFQAKFSPGARLLTNEGETAIPLKNDTVYGAVVASYGLHSTLVADSDTTEYRKHGAARFGLVAKDLLFPEDGQMPHAYKASVTLDGKELERQEHGYILAALVSNLEKTFAISPCSRPLDGKLRVLDFGPMSGGEMMGIMKAAYDSGKHIAIPEVGYRIVDEIKVQFKESGDDFRWRRCCIDGLIIGVEEGGWMKVRMFPSSQGVLDIVVGGY